MLCILQTSLSSPEGFESVFKNGFLRFVAWIFVVATAYHFVMGVKHLFADMGMNEEAESGKTAAIACNRLCLDRRFICMGDVL